MNRTTKKFRNALAQFIAVRTPVPIPDEPRNKTYEACALIRGVLDENCTIGYEPEMRTWWFQSGIEDDDGYPIIWAGRECKEFGSWPALMAGLERIGVIVTKWELEPAGRVL